MAISSRTLMLFRHRGNVPVVSRLHLSPGERFSSLALNLSLSRDSLSRSLGALERIGWVDRPGFYGEGYLLKGAGIELGPPCTRILALIQARSLEDPMLLRWSMPVIRVLSGWSLHFGELRAMLPGITPRALAMALKRMQDAGLIERRIVGGFPPSTIYRLSSKTDPFVQILKRIEEGSASS